MKKTTKQSKRWWRVPLSGSGGAALNPSTHGRQRWLVSIMLFAMMLFAPQRAGAVAGSDWGSAWSFLYRYLIETDNLSGEGSKLDYKNGNPPYVVFTVGYGCEYMGYKEGFMQNKGGLDIYASKDNGGTWTRILNLYTDQNFICYINRDVSKDCNTDGSNTTTTEYTVGTYYHQKIRWNLPIQWRNCNIKLKCVGNWCYPDGKNNGELPHKDNNGKLEESKTIFSISTPYTFTVRNIDWDGDYTIAADGTVTIPYKFSGSGNTDGYTYIYTNVNGTYDGRCGQVKPTSNYSAGTYSFNLSDIQKSFRSDNFTIQPYHEFKHENDKDNNNKVKDYKKFPSGGAKTIHKLPKAINVKASFDKANNYVMVRWESDHTNYSTGNHGTKWAIYRDGEYVDYVLQDVNDNNHYDPNSKIYTFYDKKCPHKEAVKYEIYYIWKGWNEKTTRVDELKSDLTELATVSTVITVPVKDLSATSEGNRIVFTWSTDANKADWGHEFRIYVDKETTPIATIKPTIDNQTNFAWIHRSTDKHTDRQSGVENGIAYTEEPLNACTPHDYRVESWHGNEKMESVTLTGRAIGTGTLFYSADATKGVYPGLVKLNWHVNLQGSTDAKTYIIERRTAEHESEPWETINTLTSREERLTYTDDTPLPGVYYDYRVTVQDRCDENTTITNDITIIGFAQTTGTVSGRITFGSAGTAVAGVDVIAQRIGASASGDEEQYHAMRFTGTNGAVSWEYPDLTYAKKKFASDDFSMQMWICPDEFNNVWFARLQGDNKGLGMNDGELWFCDGKQNYKFGLYLKKGRYNHVTLTRQGTTLTCYLTDLDEDGNPTIQSATQTLTGDLAFAETSELSTFTLGYFKGYVDDFRLWTKCLTKDEILENFDHLLVGNEKGLETYWTFDEGLKGQFFDSSRYGTAYHNHHGKIGSNTDPDKFTPTALKLKAKTDLDGNYIIQGVPFSGEGTTYAIIPQLGIHEFNPTQQLRYVSNNSLVHNATDFTDTSSFPVSGKIFYSGTNYPVEGVSLYVDGTICTRNGEMVTTNSEGQFEISVPIGEHYIQVKKDGHVFVNNGRFPDDPNGTNMTTRPFYQKLTGLEFRDTTLVNFTGRVVGGDIEGNMPLGGRLSTNNIGVTEIVLSPTFTAPSLNVVKKGETSVDYQNNTVTVPVPSDTTSIESTSWRGAGDDDCRKIFIHTDPGSGEFSALVPPLMYNVGAMKLVNGDQMQVGDATTVDLTNPKKELQDTLIVENDTCMYKYNAKLVQVYHAAPSFTVTQIQPNKNGAFGISSLEFSDALGKYEVKDIFSFGADSTITYKYGDDGNGHGVPLFVQEDKYEFFLHGFEKYVNADNGKVDEVPLKYCTVTINNALSSSQSVFVKDGVGYSAGQVDGLKSNQLQLDSLGHAKYEWQAGWPNISSPYTRTITMNYDINGKKYDWKLDDAVGLKGIILGDLPTGNNFVTNGPDELLTILRDPPGSGSSAEWSYGTVETTSVLEGNTWSDNFEGGVTFHFGLTVNSFTGVAAGGAATGTTMSIVDATDDQTVYAILENEGENSTTNVSSLTVTHTVSTSDDSDYVGAQGDVFIGTATNIIFGDARHIGFQKNSNGEYGLGLSDVLITGLDFTTTFNYTQSYIENTLLPNFKKLRENLLTRDGGPVSKESIKNFKNTKARAVYFSYVAPDDEHFGEEEYYEAFCPPNVKWADLDNMTDKIKEGLKDGSLYADSVKWINMQINNWEYYLALNEKEKVYAFSNLNDRSKVSSYKNYSFDSGTSITHTVERDSTKITNYEWTCAAGLLLENEFGDKKAGFGWDAHFHVEAMGGKHYSKETENDTIQSYSFTLAEEGSDAISVDVYEYGAYGPIFRTRGGQTSAPYEGEVRAKYYNENGNYPIIMEGTMQIEVPTLNVDVAEISDIPSGSAANYTLRLGNESEIGEDVVYKLYMLDETNPDGAQISVDGKVLTAEGRLIKVPANQTLTKTLQLRQTNTSILDYEGNNDADNELYHEGIGIALASESQPEDIASIVYLKAHFTPSSSPVTLALSNSTLNTQTGSNLTLTFSDFDRNYHNLKAFRIQYKRQGTTDWAVLKEYVLNDADLNGNNEKLPGQGAKVTYTLPMSTFSDGDYMFRVVSAATYGNGEVYRYSEELALVKDMQRPRPLGTPEPADGVLDIGDDLSILFNETILKGELTPELNFLITGVLNGAEIAHETALSVSSGSVTEAAAATEASINLADKDFSIDAWMNINGSGTLLSHGKGTNKLTVGTSSDGKLEVTIAGNTYTSVNSVPKDEWAFLSMNVTADGKLNITMATANETTKFFTDEPVATYSGNGPLSVGCGLDAAIHELLLWDEAHDLATALANRSKSKNPSTRHLIGYWKMDEGEGTSIRDYARSRNMAMPNETWYLNNENKAVNLDGDHYVSINAASLPITEYDDYAVEFWMRGDKQTGEAQLMQMGEVALSVNADGQLQLTGKGASSATTQPNSQFSILNSQLLDNAWHHIALNVLRQGAAAVYVDGKRCLTTNAANVGGINGDRLVIGARRTYDATVGGADNYTYDKAFKGEVDEVRVWGATMNGDLIAKNRKVRFTGSEPGLIAYYPFETKTLDTYNQIVTVGTAKDLTSSGLSAELKSLNSQPSTLNYADNAPALRTKPIETNVNFTYVTSDDKIVIEIDEDPATIEGCTLNLTVRSIRDLNGNYSEPAVWSAFVNRKELEWQDDALSLTLPVETSSTITATIVNKGGKQQMWTLEGMPAWLLASTEYGITNPRSQTDVTFTVSPATPIGKYEETIYLKGNDGIETPLTISVKVTGDEPMWSVNPSDYDETMNVIGNLFILDIPSEDSDDIVGAFIKGKCHGVAKPEYKQRYDGYYITMDIYGNDSVKNEPIEFKVYDASTGIIYPVVNTYQDKKAEPFTIGFNANDLVGLYATPTKFSATDEIEQNINLNKGWNWMSLSVKPNVFTVENVFSKANGKVEYVKNIEKSTEFDGEIWIQKSGGDSEATLTNMDNREMYVVQANEALTLNVTGHRVKSSEEPITVKDGWSWVAFNGLSVMSLDEALADMQPQDEEIIKGQRGVAYYDDHEWSGSLKQLTPGLGYKIQGKQARIFTYPTKTATGAASRMAQPALNDQTTRSAQQDACGASRSKNSLNDQFTPVDYRNYPANMVLIAQTVRDGSPVANVELGVFAGDECREAAVTDEQGMIYITIPGDEPCKLTFSTAINGQCSMVNGQSITYETDAVIGSPRAPYVIDLGKATGIAESKIENLQIENTYDLQGRKINGQPSTVNGLRKGVYIINGQKTVK